MPEAAEEAQAADAKEQATKHVTMEEPADQLDGRGDRPDKEESVKSGTPGHHIEIAASPSPRQEGEPSPGLRSSKGWDGKLRLPSAQINDPEALSDPDDSDEGSVVPGEEVPADEGRQPRPRQTGPSTHALAGLLTRPPFG